MAIDFSIYKDKDRRRAAQIVYYITHKMDDELEALKQEILEEQSENNEGES